MKSKILIISFLYVILTSSNFAEDTWENIENKTCFSLQDGIFGAQIVFLNNKFNEHKAIFQLSGSGCYVISTTIYDVDIKNDTIRLKPSFLKTNYNSELENKIFILLKDDNILQSIKGDIKYHISSEEPIIYKLCNQKVNIESLKNDTITYENFNK